MKIFLCVLGSILLSIGCRAERAESRVPAVLDPAADLAGDPLVEGDLETLNIRTVESGREPVLSLDLRNRSSSELRFAWAVEWFDRAGRRIPGSARAWTPMTLEAGSTRAIQTPMPSPDAASWRLRAVRPG